MDKLDSIIHNLDQAALKPPPPRIKIDRNDRFPMEAKVKMAKTGQKRPKVPRLEANTDPESAAKYEALVELKNILDGQFSDYSENAQRSKEKFVNPHDDDSLRGLATSGEVTSGSYLAGKSNEYFGGSGSDIFKDADRLKLPLVGLPNASPETGNLPINSEDALNILVKQGSVNNPGGLSILPVTDNDQLKSNITEMIGIDFDELIDKVSESIGEVNMPLRVEEHHTQLTKTEGQTPFYKYTETIAEVIPSKNQPRNPDVNVVSKRYEEGDLLGGEKSRFRWAPTQTSGGSGSSSKVQQQQQAIQGLGINGQDYLTFLKKKSNPTLDEISSASFVDNPNNNVKVNVTTKTNIVNVFTFNIFVNNGTQNNKKNSFTVVKDASAVPVRSSIQTTANIDSNDSLTGRPLNSISLYQYQAGSNEGFGLASAESDRESDKRRNNSMEKVVKQQEMTSMPNFSSNQAGTMASSTNSDAAELEKWLKLLMNHQVYGDGSNIVAEAVLKDSSLQQLPASEVSRTPLYRRIEDTQIQSNIGLLGYKTNMNGDIIIGSTDQTSASKSQPSASKKKVKKGFMEVLASSPIPTIVAGLAAVSPAVLAALGKRKKRKKRSENPNVDIPDQWLSYLLGTRYGSNPGATSQKDSKPQPFEVRPQQKQITPITTARSVETLSDNFENNQANKWAKYGSTAVKLSPDWYPLNRQSKPMPETSLTSRNTNENTISTETEFAKRTTAKSTTTTKMKPKAKPTAIIEKVPKPVRKINEITLESRENTSQKWTKYPDEDKPPAAKWKPYGNIPTTTTTEKWTRYEKTTAKPSTEKWTLYDKTTAKPTETLRTKPTTPKPKTPKAKTENSESIVNSWTPQIIQRRTNTEQEPKKKNSNKAQNLLNLWTELYNSKKTVQVPTKRPNQNEKIKTTKRASYDYFPIKTKSTAKTSTKSPTTTLSTTTTTTSTKTTTATTTTTTTAKTTLKESRWSMMTSNTITRPESFFPNENPIKILDEAVSVSTSTSTEVNMVPTVATKGGPISMMQAFNLPGPKFNLNNMVAKTPIATMGPPFTMQKWKRPKPQTTSDGRIKSTNVSPNLWLTAKDILHNLGSNLMLSSSSSSSDEDNKNTDMTNSPIVIIPVKDESKNLPKVNVEALKSIVSKSPITFLNMNGSYRPKRPRPTAFSTGVPKTPSKLFVEHFLKHKQTISQLRKKAPTNEESKKKIITISKFPIEATTSIGIRKPPWDNDITDPNKGIGSIEELQVPPSVNIYSPVINTNLTPEVIANLKHELETKRPPQPEMEPEPEVDSEQPEIDFYPLSSPDYAPISPPSPDYAPMSIYESYDSVPNNELIDKLKVQLQHSPIGQAINKGQWLYESQKNNYQKTETNIQQLQAFNKNSFHKGQLISWIKNLEKDVQPSKKIINLQETSKTATKKPTTTRTTTTLTTTTTTTSTTATTTTRLATPSTAPPNLVKKAEIIRNAIVTTTTTTTSTTTTTVSTTLNQSPKTFGELVASALSQSAAPLAGLSAATIAYGAAAMLPVWLPLALGKKRKRRSAFKKIIRENAADALSSLQEQQSLLPLHSAVSNSINSHNTKYRSN